MASAGGVAARGGGAAAAALVDAEAQPLIAERYIGKNVPIQVRIGFVRKVYGILTLQLFLTVAIAVPLQVVSSTWIATHQWLLWVSFIGTLCSMCSLMCCSSLLRQYPQNYAFLFTFTCFMSIMVGFVSASYSAVTVLLAASITMGIFLLLTVYAWVAATDFTGMGPYLFAALAGLCLFGMALSILNMFGVKIIMIRIFYDFIAVLLFSFYIIYDTQLILGEWGGHKEQFAIDDYCFAALSLYLDVINLFLHILALLGRED